MNNNNGNKRIPEFIIATIGIIAGLAAFFDFCLIAANKADGRYITVLSIITVGGFYLFGKFNKINGQSSFSKSPSQYTTNITSNGELFDGFKKEEDDITGIMKYVHPSIPKAFPNGFYLSIEFVNKDERYIINLNYCYRYTRGKINSAGAMMYGTGVFNLIKIYFRTDDERYNYNVISERTRTEQLGDVWAYKESGTIAISEKMFKDIATSVNLKIRLEGLHENSNTTFTEDIDLSEFKKRQYVVDAYNAYEANSANISFIS